MKKLLCIVTLVLLAASAIISSAVFPHRISSINQQDWNMDFTKANTSVPKINFDSAIIHHLK